MPQRTLSVNINGSILMQHKYVAEKNAKVAICYNKVHMQIFDINMYTKHAKSMIRNIL